MNEINYKNWKSENNTLVIVYSESCPNCKIAIKHIDDCKENGVEIKLLNFDTEVDLCDNIFEIFEVPSYLYLKKGKISGRMFGLQEPLTVKGFARIHKDETYN